MEQKGIDVLLDDRDARPGFKFKDADLIGIPVRVTVGKKALAQGMVELKMRTGGESEQFPPDTIVEEVVNRVAQAKRKFQGTSF